VLELPLLIGAFFAGVFMFLAPCTLPIVPGYLAFISGVSLGKTAGGLGAGERRAVMRNAFSFVLGFSALFIALGASAGLLGGALGAWRPLLAQAAGLLIILFGVTTLGVVRLPWISGERHVALPRFLSLGRPESSFLIGALFALGWSPCIGPILGTILLVASTEGLAMQGAVLLGVFSLGLGIPFLLTAALIQSAAGAFSHLAGFLRGVSLFGGLFLILIGALMLFGKADLLVVWGYSLFNFAGYERLLEYL
jgi:cytochrome c-type biogenesis protein